MLARGRRTVTVALRHTGQGDTPSFSLYHQVFNRTRWSAPGSSPEQALKGSRCLLALLVQTPVCTGAGSSTLLAAASRSSMGLSDLLEGSLSYDQITRFLSQQRFDSKTLWQLVKPDEACCAFCVKTKGGGG